MYSAERIYSLDIETDTSADGLDPRISRITEIAVETASGAEVFVDESERAMLSQANEFIRELSPGLIVTWNGAKFDIPFIVTRASRYESSGIGISSFEMPSLPGWYRFLPGWDHACGCTWAAAGGLAHQHLDICYAYRRFADLQRVKWALKPVCRASGIEMIEVDRTRMHELTPEERREYAISDVHGTRELAVAILGA
jgi:DNA polymerase elongation subunit (family B)